jgi:AsmA protein
MSRLFFAVLIIVGMLVAVPVQAQESSPAQTQAQKFTETVRQAVIVAVKEKTGRTLVINGELSFSMAPRPQMTAKQVILSNPEGFGATPFISMDQIDITFDLGAALTGNMVINGFVMDRPKINFVVNKAGRNNWSFGAKALQAGVFEISNATVNYFDARSKAAYTFEDVNLKIDAPTVSDTLKAAGSLRWNNEKVALVSSLATLELLNKGSVAKINIKLDAKRFSTDLSANFSQQKDGLKLANIKLLSNDMNASGKMSFKYGKVRPYVNADFKLDQLDLTKYLGNSPKNSRKTTRWSKQEIDFSSLKAIDGDFKLSLDSVQYQKIRTGAARLVAKLRGGVLRLNLANLALYEGAAKLILSIDGRKPKAAVKVSGNVRNVRALPFLLDAADIRKIEGRTNLDFNLTSKGRSQFTFMRTLTGTANIKFRKGALLGINIARILRSIKRGKTSGFARGGKTPFGRIVADFRFRKGVGANKRLRVSGGEVLMSGGGKVRMPNQTLSYRVRPSLAGRGGISVLGINVPIIIAGPWANPRIYPDLPGFLDAPEIALKGLTTVGKGGIEGVTGVVEKVTSPIGKIIQAPFKKLF